MRVKLQCQFMLHFTLHFMLHLSFFDHFCSRAKTFSQFESPLRSIRYGLGVELTRWRWQFHFGIMYYNALSSAPHDIFISHLFCISHSTSMLVWPSSGSVTDFWNTVTQSPSSTIGNFLPAFFNAGNVSYDVNKVENFVRFKKSVLKRNVTLRELCPQYWCWDNFCTFLLLFRWGSFEEFWWMPSYSFLFKLRRLILLLV